MTSESWVQIMDGRVMEVGKVSVGDGGGYTSSMKPAVRLSIQRVVREEE